MAVIPIPGAEVEDIGNVEFVLPGEPVFVTHDVAILVGEIIYNLRGALDYLVYEIARFDSKQIQSGTQFPIANDEAEWMQYWVAQKLRGVNTKHKTKLEKLQPFNGCEWTKLLQNLSNPDKHRHLIGTYGYAGVAMVLSRLRVSATGKVSVTAEAQGGTPSVILHFDNPEDGRRYPLVETLDMLTKRVAEVIDDFDPEPLYEVFIFTNETDALKKEIELGLIAGEVDITLGNAFRRLVRCSDPNAATYVKMKFGSDDHWPF